MFEKASRMKLRFDTPRGRLTVEDLWDLPLIGNEACLDNIAKVLYRELKDETQESFVIKAERSNEELTTKFEIVKHVIDVRLQEEEAAKNAAQARRKKQQILAIIAEKETETLKDSSIDDLRALLESL
jgi:hypothetical protein